MSKCVSNMLSQDVSYIRTFLDTDCIVGQKCIDAGVKLKEIYKDKVKIDLAIQPLEGLEDKKSRYNFIEACEKADYIGGLPDRDSSHRKHICGRSLVRSGNAFAHRPSCRQLTSSKR